MKIIVEKNRKICKVTFNDPEKLNALTPSWLREFSEVLSNLELDDEIGVVILTGKGKAFIAGADIPYMKEMNPQEAANYARFTTNLYRRMEEMNKVFIAQVNGFALGGGCEVALACDIRVASEAAKFGLPEVTLGILPGGGGTQRLARLVGQGKARELIFTGDIINAEEAKAIGLVNSVVPPEELEEETNRIAAKILKNSLSAVRYSKEAILTGQDLDLHTAINVEKELFALCFTTKDQKEGMAAFVEKRKPNYKQEGGNL
ncbi:MAG: enoyl-CoA hydratase/isomerase family protein [Peptostreptococcaceae bacterium]|nr:enoyl-CoA hydratase/isomerase family protein [Peptostreptococcaceae bacterium]